MKDVEGEVIVRTFKVKRKGRGGHDQTEFELGIGYCVDGNGKPTGEVRLRTEQIDSGVAPLVATIENECAEGFCTALIDSIALAAEGLPRAA